MCVKDFVKKGCIVMAWPILSQMQVFAQPVSPVIGKTEIPVAKAVTAFPLELAVDQTSVLIFPAAIKSVDRGNAQILSKTVREANNVLKLKSASDSLPITNLSVFTADGRIYPFAVTYNPHPAYLTLDFTGQALPGSWRPVSFSDHGLNDADIRLYSQVVADLPGYQSRPRSNRIGGMRMEINGNYVQQGILFFQFSIQNKSRLPFNIDFTRCYIRDNRQSRRSSSMEKEIHPLFIHFSDSDSVPAHRSIRLVMAFDQFTIADSKHLAVELFEKGGDRNLRTRIKGKHILHLRQLLPYLLNKYHLPH